MFANCTKTMFPSGARTERYLPGASGPGFPPTTASPTNRYKSRAASPTMLVPTRAASFDSFPSPNPQREAGRIYLDSPTSRPLHRSSPSSSHSLAPSESPEFAYSAPHYHDYYRQLYHRIVFPVWKSVASFTAHIQSVFAALPWGSQSIVSRSHRRIWRPNTLFDHPVDCAPDCTDLV